MAGRPRINPLSVLFVLAIVLYGIYTGTRPSQRAGKPTVPVSSDTANGRRTEPLRPEPADRVLAGRVVTVADGDTVEILVDRRPMRIRLYAIDAPEHGQAYGNAARDYLRQLCYGKTAHAMILGTDRYGRTVGDVYVDSLWINGEMVRAGYAWWYRRFSQSTELEQLERSAQRNRLGLWADKAPTAPWEFRQQHNQP
jgi:endonuclease YncB( thermonuclease family)